MHFGCLLLAMFLQAETVLTTWFESRNVYEEPQGTEGSVGR